VKSVELSTIVEINAAKNIRDEGVRILSADPAGIKFRQERGGAFRTSGTGEIAYCPDVSRDSRGRKTATVSQFDG